MKAQSRLHLSIVLLLIGGLLFSSFLKPNSVKPQITLPYKKAGLTERQAAAHLLNRLTYGAKPGEVDVVLKAGLEKWVQDQLTGKLQDDSLDNLIKDLDVEKLTSTEISDTYPKTPLVLRMAIKDGFIDKDSVKVDGDKKAYRDKIEAYMSKNGFKPQQELYRQFINQKILRSAYTNNQLQELLTDFWFNHFNVSLTKPQCAEYIPVYERDVIRPNVYGKFDNLLIKTAKSAAMLTYLDNFSSSGTNSDMEDEQVKQLRNQMLANARRAIDVNDPRQKKLLERIDQAKKKKKEGGLNENYAREVMELHTLGVDGGYTQNDVTQAAKILTGWTLYPASKYGYNDNAKKMLDKLGSSNFIKQGFVHEGDFLFAPNRHESGEKVVLGKKFYNQNGYQEGVDLLQMLAHHPSTAKFISTKLATRFVSDNPPASLVNKMAKTFLEKDGDIREVMLTMITSTEFWSKDALREKTKSPFELAISSVRSLNGVITQPYQLYSWINKMGQKMYYYQAPTGFPDKADYWINTGALLNRMNFGLALASQRIPGVHVRLASLNKNREPESAEAALKTYSMLMMPERDLTETLKRLTPMLNDPQLQKKVSAAAEKNVAPQKGGNMMNEDAMIDDYVRKKEAKANFGKNGYIAMQNSLGDNTMLSQVVGVIIGSPEFQRK